MDEAAFTIRGGMSIIDRRRTFWAPFGRTRNIARWPFGRLHATAERLSISAPTVGAYVVTHGNLLSITPFGWVPVIGVGLRFEAYFRPQVAEFWTFDLPVVIAELAALGWNVTERSEDGPRNG